MNGKKVLYIYLDEGGNMNFSAKGTAYFTLTSLMTIRPFTAYKELTELRYDLIEQGRNIEYFHATEDKQAVRDAIYNVMKKYVKKLRVDSLIVEKRKVSPELRDEGKFYPEMMGYLLPFAVKQTKLNLVKEIIIFTDVIPIQRKRRAVEKAIKQTLSQKMPKVPYAIYHHNSKSNSYLQMVDYFNWALFRKWEKGDERSYNLIKEAVRSEFDIFRKAQTRYY